MDFGAYQTSGASDVSVRFRPGGALTSVQFWEFHGLRFNLSTGSASTVGTNALSVSRINGKSTGINTIIHSQTMNSTLTDHEYYPNRPRRMRGTDHLAITWTNDAGSAKSWGLEIDYETP